MGSCVGGDGAVGAAVGGEDDREGAVGGVGESRGEGVRGCGWSGVVGFWGVDECCDGGWSVGYPDCVVQTCEVVLLREKCNGYFAWCGIVRL